MTADAKNVVITGSTRGIGKGMAREFLNRGHNVVISGRTQESVDAALADLKDAAEAKGAHLAGVPCDVGDINQVQSLWDKAVEHLGSVGIWINNAGRTNSSNKIATLPAGEFSGVVGTNLLGTMYGCQVALRGMQAQGHGAGSDRALHEEAGRGVPGSGCQQVEPHGDEVPACKQGTECHQQEQHLGPEGQG